MFNLLCSFASGLEPRAQKAAEFVAEFLYGSNYDFACKQAVRHMQPLEEVLEHSTIDKIWKQRVVEEAPNLGHEEGVDTNLSQKSVLVNLVSNENLSKLTQPEQAAKLEFVENDLLGSMCGLRCRL